MRKLPNDGMRRLWDLPSSQALSDSLPNKNKKGESLEVFDHVLTWLNMVGRGLQSFDHTLQDHTLVA